MATFTCSPTPFYLLGLSLLLQITLTAATPTLLPKRDHTLPSSHPSSTAINRSSSTATSHSPSMTTNHTSSTAINHPTPTISTHPTHDLDSHSHRTTSIVAGIAITAVILIVLIAALILYRKKPHLYHRRAAGPPKDKGFKTTYWSQGNAPANHPMLGEAGMGMLHLQKEPAHHSQPSAEDEASQGLLSGASAPGHRSTASIGALNVGSGSSSVPPPVYTEHADLDRAASSELHPAPLRPRSVSPGPGRAPYPGSLEDVDGRGKSHDQGGLTVTTSQGEKLDRARSRSVSRFREEGMIDVDVSDSMSLGMERGRR